jgi:bd-type cytochrome oxidase subunit I
MDLSALVLSRLQFAFTVSFHIIFPSFTIGLAAWLTVLETLHLATGRPAQNMNARLECGAAASSIVTENGIMYGQNERASVPKAANPRVHLCT